VVIDRTFTGDISGGCPALAIKLMVLRSLLPGVDFLVIDPEVQYRALCAEVDGQYVRCPGPGDAPLRHGRRLPAPFQLTALLTSPGQMFPGNAGKSPVEGRENGGSGRNRSPKRENTAELKEPAMFIFLASGRQK
jgi:hypothetical protein